MEYALGVDLGNVIIDHNIFGTTREFLLNGDYNIIPAVPRVLESLKVINASKLFNERVFVIYNATDVADQKILSWMENRNFYQVTGIIPHRICRSRDGRNKLNFCLDNNITHFVDDRLEVLSHLIGHVPNLFLLNSQPEEVKQFKNDKGFVNEVDTWGDIVNAILPNADL